MSYPQIVGTNDPIIQKINQDIKQVATEQYQWPLTQPKGDPHPGTVNTVNLTYEIGQATDSLLSFFFVGYHSGIGAPKSVQERVTLNYDLTSGKQLKLSDIFRPGSKYLEFISRYCIEELSIDRELRTEAVAAVPENFKSWHITSDGISLNFEAHEVSDYIGAAIETVDIPFSAMKPLLKPGIPGKFNITYPYN